MACMPLPMKGEILEHALEDNSRLRIMLPTCTWSPQKYAQVLNTLEDTFGDSKQGIKRALQALQNLRPIHPTSLESDMRYILAQFQAYSELLEKAGRLAEIEEDHLFDLMYHKL